MIEMIDWRPAADRPHHNGAVFGCCPDVEDGRAVVLVRVVRCCDGRDVTIPGNTIERARAGPFGIVWLDEYGQPVNVTDWTPIRFPDPPGGKP